MSEITTIHLLTEDELAKELQIPPRTVRYFREQGTGPRVVRVGKHVRYRLTDV